MRYIKKITIFLLILFSFQIGCISKTFDFKKLAKSDVDMVADIHLSKSIELIKQLTIKLYKRNPCELKSGMTPQLRIKQIFTCPVNKSFKEINFKQGIEAIKLCFDQDFKGDRIFALISGLYSMILNSYGNRCEFFLLNQLDEQKLYNSARNIEILVWRIRNKHKKNNKLFILTDEINENITNLSFERILGKLISIQDIMALIIADKNNRIINKIIFSTTTAFLPISF